MRAPLPFPVDGNVTDEEIVSRIREGEVLLFEVLMRRHNARVYRVVRSVLRNESEVEDVMQGAYLHAYSNLASFRGASRFSTWLSHIAFNEALGRLRSERRHPAVSLSLVEESAMPSSSPSPESLTSRTEVGHLLEQAVDALPELYRSVFMLREIEGLDTAETAEILAVSEDVVKTRLLRARAALRKILEEIVGGAASDAFGFHATRCDRVVGGVMAKLAG